MFSIFVVVVQFCVAFFHFVIPNRQFFFELAKINGEKTVRVKISSSVHSSVRLECEFLNEFFGDYMGAMAVAWIFHSFSIFRKKSWAIEGKIISEHKNKLLVTKRICWRKKNVFSSSVCYFFFCWIIFMLSPCQDLIAFYISLFLAFSLFLPYHFVYLALLALFWRVFFLLFKRARSHLFEFHDNRNTVFATVPSA